MPTQQLALPPPLAGLNKRATYSMKEEGYTADSLNVWPTDWSSGRERISTRAGISGAGSPGGIPHNWSPVSWSDNGAHIGISLATSTGLKLGQADGSGGITWTTAVGGVTLPTDFTTTTGFLNKIFMAVFGQQAVVYDPVTGTDQTLLAAVNEHLGPSGGGPGVDETPNNEVGDWLPPADCGIVQAWGDRLVMAGSLETPHIVFMSKIGEYRNWNYAADNRAQAVALDGTDGIIGEPVTALIPHNRECLLIGCTDSIYVVRGNPALSGQIETLSHMVGPLEQSAWCKDGEDRTWMLTRDGLYMMPPGCGQPPIKASRQIIPEDLVAINPSRSTSSGDKVAICYDNRFNGIHIFVNYSHTSSGDVSYFYDLANGGYWRQSFGPTFNLGCTLKSASSEDKSGAMLIADNGTAYRFDRDSSERIDSHCYWGPIPVGSPHNDGILISVEGTIAQDSNEAEMSVFGGHSPTEAFNKTSPSFSMADWQPSGTRHTQYRQYPRVRCGAAYIKASGSDRWSIEEVAVTVAQVGAKRV